MIASKAKWAGRIGENIFYIAFIIFVFFNLSSRTELIIVPILVFISMKITSIASMQAYSADLREIEFARLSARVEAIADPNSPFDETKFRDAKERKEADFVLMSVDMVSWAILGISCLLVILYGLIS